MWIGEQKWNLGCSCVNLSGFSKESPVRCNQFSLCHLHLRADNRQDYSLKGAVFLVNMNILDVKENVYELWNKLKACFI